MGTTEGTSDSQFAESASIVQKRRLAEANGKFYNSFLDIYLGSASSDERKTKTNGLVESLPSHIRGLYKEGVRRYEEELGINHDLVAQHKGDEAKYLIGAVLHSEKKEEVEIREVLDQVTPENVRYIEPFPGVAVLEAEKDFFAFLQEKGFVNGEASEVAFLSDGRDEPSFMMVRRMSLEASLAEGRDAKSKSSLRHEYHHFIWNFLQRSGFVREVSEETPELARAFKYFRNELCAYTVANRAIGEIDSEALVYTKDAAISEKATDVRNYINVCMEVAKGLGEEPATFIYAAMTSRNFWELMKKCYELTPLTETGDSVTLNALYTVWSSMFLNNEKLGGLVRQKGTTFPKEIFSSFVMSQLSSPDLVSLYDMTVKFDAMKRFSGVIGMGDAAGEDVLDKVVSGRLTLPPETVSVLKGLPVDLSRDVPLGVSLEDFIRQFISFWRVKDEGTRGCYATLLNSSPVVREAFDKVKEDIVLKGAQGYRKEMGDSDRRQKTEAEIAERSKLILGL